MEIRTHTNKNFVASVCEEVTSDVKRWRAVWRGLCAESNVNCGESYGPERTNVLRSRMPKDAQLRRPESL